MTRFLECPRKYRYEIIEGWVGKKKRVELEYGILFHKALERYHKLKAQNMSEDDAAEQALRFLLERAADFEPDEDGYRTKYTLTRAFIWYIDRFRNDNNVTHQLPDGKPAVELSFRVGLPLITPEGDSYLFCGHVDRVSVFNDETFVNDYKTTKSSLSKHYFKQFDTSWQITGYIFGAATLMPDPPHRAIIDGVQLCIDFNRFERKITERSPEQIREWLRDFVEWLKLAEYYAEKDYWPMNRASCTMYGGCPFSEVCGKSSEDTRELILKTDFQKRFWNPLEPR